ncbi:pentapeptide repeat-containing protein [Rhodococcus jostii]|uniref:pentapeptide repeat-containing protein n=1 Tax=Rhodococcus jostii TaxID=132919 RepID=UPI00363D4C80
MVFRKSGCHLGITQPCAYQAGKKCSQTFELSQADYEYMGVLMTKQTRRSAVTWFTVPFAVGMLAAAGCVATLGVGTALADPAVPTDGAAKACVTVEQLLPGVNCAYSDLPGIDAAGHDMHGINLSNSTLTRATLRRVNLTGANLGAADLTGVDGRSANLSRADLSDVEFVGGDPFGANLTGANLTENRLQSANLTGGVKLTGANLTRADLWWGDLTGANLTGANLNRPGSSGDFVQATSRIEATVGRCSR